MEPIDIFRKELGAYLKEMRKESAMTQAEVAQSIGCHNQFLSNIERGVCSPPNDVFQKLITLYKLKESDVLKKMDNLQHTMWKQTLFPKGRKRKSS